MGRLGVFNINIWILLLLSKEGLRVRVFDNCVKNLRYYDLFCFFVLNILNLKINDMKNNLEIRVFGYVDLL